MKKELIDSAILLKDDSMIYFYPHVERNIALQTFLDVFPVFILFLIILSNEINKTARK